MNRILKTKSRLQGGTPLAIFGSTTRFVNFPECSSGVISLVLHFSFGLNERHLHHILKAHKLYRQETTEKLQNLQTTPIYVREIRV